MAYCFVTSLHFFTCLTKPLRNKSEKRGLLARSEHVRIYKQIFPITYSGLILINKETSNYFHRRLANAVIRRLKFLGNGRYKSEEYTVFFSLFIDMICCIVHDIEITLRTAHCLRHIEYSQWPENMKQFNSSVINSYIIKLKRHSGK